MFSNYKRIKLEINNRKKSGTPPPNIWKLHNTLPNNSIVKDKIKREIRKYFDLNKNNPPNQNV